jgi:hypothetical protein
MGMQSVGGVFLIAGAELSMGTQKWGGGGMGSVMVISQMPGASVVDCLSLYRRNAEVLPRWARVVMYGQRCGGECLGDGDIH